MDWEADELLALARIDMQKGTVDAALLKLKQAVRLPDVAPEVSIELARLYAQIGLRKKAIPFFREYLDAVPSDIDAKFQIGMAHFEEGEVEVALAIWSDVLSVDSRYPPALFYQAAAEARTGRVESAKGSLRNALDSIPPDNLYFSRSRELLTALENNAEAATSALDGGIVGGAGKIQH